MPHLVKELDACTVIGHKMIEIQEKFSRKCGCLMQKDDIIDLVAKGPRTLQEPQETSLRERCAVDVDDTYGVDNRCLRNPYWWVRHDDKRWPMCTQHMKLYTKQFGWISYPIWTSEVQV